MRVAFISAENPVGSIGGAGNTVSNWLDALTRRDVTVDVFCQGAADESYEAGGVQVTQYDAFRPRDRIERALEAGEYDVVLTQNLWTDIALEAAAATDTPSVYLVHDTFADEDLVAEWSPTRFLANSKYTQQWITSVWGRDSAVVYPHIDFEFYDVPAGESDAISMLNPVNLKGGHVFKEIAERMPDRKFLTKTGWYRFRNDDYTWDLDQLHLQQTTFHGLPEDVPDSEVRTPTDVTFEDTPNVTHTHDPGILEFYAKTRVIVIPSTWNETFGRVALEAMWNGIPVVAHNHGGIPEACGGAALLVDDVGNAEEWEAKLRKLDDPGVYEGFAKRGRERAERYRQKQPEQIDTLQTVLEEAAAEG